MVDALTQFYVTQAPLLPKQRPWLHQLLPLPLFQPSHLTPSSVPLLTSILPLPFSPHQLLSLPLVPTSPILSPSLRLPPSSVLHLPPATPPVQVRTWPRGLVSMPLLVDVVAARMKRPGGENDHLWRLLALLYQRQVRGVGQACVRQLVGAGCVLIVFCGSQVSTQV